MQDKNGNILLKPSPLKGKKSQRKNAGKYAGEDNYANSMEDLNDLKETMQGIGVDNPFADADNAFAGLPNQYADMDNVYEGSKNVYKDKMKNAFAGQENAYEGMKNQYEDMENAFEDMKVNTQQAEFEAQANAQQQANIMSQMRGAAGTSGVAALAQSMANQGALQAQKASASIGAQEGQNAKLAAEAGQKISMAVAGEGSKIAMSQAGEQARLDTQERSAEMDIQAKVLGADEALQAQRLGEQSKLNMAEAKGATDLQMAAAQGAMTVQELQGKGYMWEREQELGKARTQMEATMGMMSSAGGQASQPKKGKVVCNELYEQGYLPKEVLELDNQYAYTSVDMRTKIGYWAWAIPVVNAMRKSKIVTQLIRPFGVAWAYEMAHKVEPHNYNGNILGKVMMVAGTILCRFIGNATVKSSPVKRIDLSITLAVFLILGFFVIPAGAILCYLLPGIVRNTIIKPSPLKQVGAKPDGKILQAAQKAKGELTSGMAMLSEDQRRKNWEELALLVSSIKPASMLIQEQRDKILKKNQRNILGDTGVNQDNTIPNENIMLNAMHFQIIGWQKELLEALEASNKRKEKEVKIKLANLKRIYERFKEVANEYYRDHFQADSYLSKGVSQQEQSYATQIYCENTELLITHAEKEDVINKQLDCFGELVIEGGYYAAILDYSGNPTLCNILQANKNQFWVDPMSVLAYGNFLVELNEQAKEAAAAKSVVKPPLDRINYEVNQMMGNNDDTATIKQDQLVISYAWDEDITMDGNSFRRHLFEHPQLQNLNYGGFDYDNMKFNPPLGPGDTNHWADEIDDLDRLMFVDAICNQDSSFFDIKLLRTLVKEYITHKLESSWWKGMGYEEGKLEIMRMKAMELRKQRYKMAEADAAKSGAKNFKFDGEIFKTSKRLLAAQAEKDKETEDIMTGKKQPPPESSFGGEANAQSGGQPAQGGPQNA